MTSTRFQELKTKGWVNLNREEKAEYQKLKRSEPTLAVLPVDMLPKCTIEPEFINQKPSLMSLLEQLLVEFKDGNNRALARSYMALKTSESDEKILWSLMKDIKDGNDKAKVFQKIKQINPNA